MNKRHKTPLRATVLPRRAGRKPTQLTRPKALIARAEDILRRVRIAQAECALRLSQGKAIRRSLEAALALLAERKKIDRTKRISKT